MHPSRHERRQAHSPDEELSGIAARSLREGVPVAELYLRKSDTERVDELRSGAKGKLLAMAGYTTEQAAVELQPVTPAKKKARTEFSKKVLNLEQKTSLFSTLENRFAADTKRYKDIQWPAVKAALEAADESVLFGLLKMEENGHEVGVSEVEKDGKKGYRFDSCSALSPTGIRNVDHFRAEEIAEKEWGVPLMSPDVARELMAVKIITERGTWSHLKTDGETLEKGRSWYVFDIGVRKRNAYYRSHNGGFRCSLWVPAVY